MDIVLCLRGYAHGSTVDRTSTSMALQAADEIEQLRARVALVERWQAEGEAHMGAMGFGAMFDLGGWWADRPWRKREEQA